MALKQARRNIWLRATSSGFVIFCTAARECCSASRKCDQIDRRVAERIAATDANSFAAYFSLLLSEPGEGS